MIPLNTPTLSRRARNRTRAKFPELWDGLIAAYAPALGWQDRHRIEDLSGSGLPLVLSTGDTQFGSVANTNAKFALIHTQDVLSTSTFNHGIGTGPFSWVWRGIKRSSTAHGVCANGNFAPGMYTRTNTSAWGFYWNSYLYGATSLTDNIEYTLAAVREGTTVTLYLDAKSDASGTRSDSMANDLFHVGGSPGVKGDADTLEVYFYNRTLSVGDLHLLHNVHLAPFYEKRQRVFIVPAAASPASTPGRFNSQRYFNHLLVR